MNERREEREKRAFVLEAKTLFYPSFFIDLLFHLLLLYRETERERETRKRERFITKHTQRANDDIDGIIILRFTVLFFQQRFLEKKKFDDDDKQALEKRKTKCIRASGNHRNFPGVARIVQVRDSSAHWTRGFREANVPMGGHDVHRRRFGDVREADGNFGDK